MKIGSHIGDIAQTIPGLKAPVKGLRTLLERRRPAGPRPTQAYFRWVRDVDTPSRADIRMCRVTAAAFPWQPTISLLMPIFDPKPSFLSAAIRSVREQAYPWWELCVAVDASTKPGVATVLRRHGAADPRIKVAVHDAHGVAAASNTSLEMATGDFIARLEPADLLPPLALYRVVEAINGHPRARILYSDEDKVDGRGLRLDPHFKGDFNHALLLARNTMSRLGVYQRDLVVSVGGFRAGFEGAEDHDLVLRCVAGASREEILHIPRILYHARVPAGGGDSTVPSTPATVTAAQRAVAEHVRHIDVGAVVEPAPEAPMFLRVRHSLPTPAPLVSIVICTRDHASLLRTAVESIQSRTTYGAYEIVVLDNGSRDVDAMEYLTALSAQPNVTVIRDDSPFNYSRLNNLAVGHARGTVVCLLNDDIEVLAPGWLEEMVSFAVQPDIGAVGARLWYPDGTLQHGGVIIGLGGVAGHAHLRLARGDGGYFCRAVLQQELSAVTGACLVMRRDVFDEVGGLDERIAVAFNDVDLCLRIRAAGYRIIWTPFAELIHHESASRGQEDNPQKIARFHREVQFMHERWGAVLANDPHYNPNLSMHAGDFALALREPPTTRRRAA